LPFAPVGQLLLPRLHGAEQMCSSEPLRTTSMQRSPPFAQSPSTLHAPYDRTVPVPIDAPGTQICALEVALTVEQRSPGPHDAADVHDWKHCGLAPLNATHVPAPPAPLGQPTPVLHVLEQMCSIPPEKLNGRQRSPLYEQSESYTHCPYERTLAARQPDSAPSAKRTSPPHPKRIVMPTLRLVPQLERSPSSTLVRSGRRHARERLQ
jgi:hypothetical protein